MATTDGTTPQAPQDPAPFGPDRNRAASRGDPVVYGRPGGPAVAALPATELGSQTWVPVIQSQPGWDRILLPSRPDRSAGWIYLDGGGLQTAYSPLILPLGTHSNTLDTFGGGPGTVALHSWPDPSVFGHAVSHRCVRVPAAALRALSRVPLGSPVLITG